MRTTVDYVGSGKASWASSPTVRNNMRANRGRDTAPELALRKLLHARGLRYFVQRRPIPELRRTADIVFPKLKVAIFVDGCFWHGCPDHHTVAMSNAAYWSAKVQSNRARDADTDRFLREAGWLPVRIWEHVESAAAADLVQQLVERLRADS